MSEIPDLLAKSISAGLVEKKGTWIFLPDGSKVQGNKQFDAWCRDHPGFAEKLETIETDIAMDIEDTENTEREPTITGFERLRQALLLFVTEPKYQLEGWLLEEYAQQLVLKRGAHSSLPAARFVKMDGEDFWSSIMQGRLQRLLVREFEPTRKVLEGRRI